jgi:hypothetical protein
MRHAFVAPAALLGALALAACDTTPVSVGSGDLASTEPGLAVNTGEKFSFIRIITPKKATWSMKPDTTKQMKAKLYFSEGGTLAAVPYASWRSTDECVATVTNAHPSWGKVKSLRSGSTLIIAEAFGEADTVAVTVTGGTPPDPACYDAGWAWDFTDVSFTGTPASSYGTSAGESLTRLVLFAGPKPDWTISTGAGVRLRSELWYDQGGKLNGRGFVTFSVTDGAVARIDQTGLVTGLAAGRTKVIARLGGSFADTVPLYVR